MSQHRYTRLASLVAALAGTALLAAGCASANKTDTAASAGSAGSTSVSSTSSSAMNMNMGSSSAGGASSAAVAQELSVDGIHPVPTQILGIARWQGMKIAAQAMTAVPFVIYDGTSEKLVKPGHSSFHLMVMLNDAETGVPIPYASVWATISEHGKVVFDERQWPMLSRYMGPHYGNDVTLPGAGSYTLKLLVSPPVAARHIEYQNVWLKPHIVDFAFHWKPLS
jgi:hypothetical protein